MLYSTATSVLLIVTSWKLLSVVFLKADFNNVQPKVVYLRKACNLVLVTSTFVSTTAVCQFTNNIISIPTPFLMVQKYLRNLPFFTLLLFHLQNFPSSGVIVFNCLQQLHKCSIYSTKIKNCRHATN
jgi:hypothetical protein